MVARWELALAPQGTAPAGSTLGLALVSSASWRELRLPTIGARLMVMALAALAALAALVLLVPVARRETAQWQASFVQVAGVASELMAASMVALLRGASMLASHLVSRPKGPP